MGVNYDEKDKTHECRIESFVSVHFYSGGTKGRTAGYRLYKGKDEQLIGGEKTDVI